MTPTNSHKRRTTVGSLPIFAAASLALVLGAIAVAATAPGTHFSGGATGAFVHTGPLETASAATGGLTLATGEQVSVSHAHSDIACGQEAPVLKDFVSGGGFIGTSSGTANFAFVAGLKPGASVASGHLTYIDHASGMKVKATDINNDYDGSGATRTFSGLATVNGVSGYTFKVTVTDNGEPGRGVDTFYIVLSTGYEAGGTLAGGNIQLHA